MFTVFVLMMTLNGEVLPVHAYASMNECRQAPQENVAAEYRCVAVSTELRVKPARLARAGS